MKITIQHLSLFLFSFFILIFFQPQAIAQQNNNNAFVKGADIGWLPQMEASGYQYYNDSGVKEDVFQILKSKGINTIRLRTWVNPSNDPASGHNSKDETVAMAVRAKNWGIARND